MNLWYLLLIPPAILVIVAFAIALAEPFDLGTNWGSSNKNKVKDKKMRKSKLNQLNEQINKLTKAVEEVNNKFQILQEEIEVYKFKQNVKNGFQFNLEYIPINPNSLDFNTIHYQTVVREDGTVYTSTVGIT